MSTATIWAWEFDHRVVRPAQTQAGESLYSERDLGVLREMATLIDQGLRPSEAAAALAGAYDENAAPLTVAPNLVQLAKQMDGIEEGFREVVRARGLEDALDDWLLPEVFALGESWAAGNNSVAEEHLATAGLMSVMSGLLSSALRSVPASAPRAIVGLTEGSRHELGLLAFALCLARQGIHVTYLGADVPRGDWPAAACAAEASIVVLGAPRASDLEAAQATIDGISSACWELTVAVGGGNAEHLTGAMLLPGRVSEAAEIVAEHLGHGEAKIA